MAKNKYIPFFTKYRLRNNKDNEYSETYNYMKDVYTKQLGIEVNKIYGETEYEKINKNIKYEKIKIEGLLEKNKAVQATVSGVVVPIAVVAFVAEATFYQEVGFVGLCVFIIFIIGAMLTQFAISMKRATENHVYSTILKVLEDIEKEEPKLIKGNQSTDNAETITAKEKLREYNEKRHDKKKYSL